MRLQIHAPSTAPGDSTVDQPVETIAEIGGSEVSTSGGHLRKLIAVRMINFYQSECGEKLRRSEQQLAVIQASPDNKCLDEILLRGMRDGPRAGPSFGDKAGDLGKAFGKVRESAEILRR